MFCCSGTSSFKLTFLAVNGPFCLNCGQGHGHKRAETVQTVYFVFCILGSFCSSMGNKDRLNVSSCICFALSICLFVLEVACLFVMCVFRSNFLFVFCVC